MDIFNYGQHINVAPQNTGVQKQEDKPSDNDWSTRAADAISDLFGNNSMEEIKESYYLS